MEIIKTKRNDGEKLSEQLSQRGFVSRNYVINREVRDRFKIPEYSTLRQMAENGSIIAVKTITEESGVTSYWFDKRMIESMFINYNQQTSPLILTVKVDESHLEQVRDKYIKEIESKANELFDITQKINKEQRDNIIIFCPYTIGACQTIWNECIASVMAASKLNITVKYAEKKEKLDSGVPDNTYWQSGSQSLDNYQFMK